MWDLDPSKNVMVDIETLASTKTASILSIGACTLDEKDTFYINVDISSCIKAGLDIEGKTFYWWLAQSDSAREALLSKRTPLKAALSEFSSYLLSISDNIWQNPDLYMWSHGSDFDLAILANAYTVLGVHAPWQFRNTRDTRTMFHLFPQPKWDRVGTTHNALDDAITQSRALMNAHSDYRRLYIPW